jgi:type IV pilus assembly protein PilC
MEAKKAFMKHQDKLGKFTAYMLGIASRSGNMAEIFEATARFLERRDQFNKSIRSAMITPAITMFATIAAFIWYVWYIFPKTAGLFENFDVELPAMTAATLEFSHWMDANYLWVMLVLGLMVGAGFLFVRSARGEFLVHKYMIKIPGLGKLFHKLNVEIFCRVFAVLYSGSGQNIDVIKMAAEATGNRYISHQVKSITIPQMVAQGAGLVPAMEASGVFTQMAISRFRSGAETGSVRRAARQMADFYAKETDLKLDMVLQSIQTGVSIFISMAIMLLTLLSAEMAKIQPSPADMMGM